jgi:hypothetical protein
MPMVFIAHAARTGNPLGDQWRRLSRTSLATSVLTLVAAGCLMACAGEGHRSHRVIICAGVKTLRE